MHIAITGGMGFIGSEVASLFEGTGDEVTIVDHWQTRLRDYERARYPILETVYCNLSTAASVMNPEEFIVDLKARSPDVIIHLGAVVDTTDLGSTNLFHSNVDYTRELIRAANLGRLANDVPAIIFASSAATYGSDFIKPNNPYGLTKVMGEKALFETRGQFAALRFFNVFGANEHHKEGMASLPFKIAQAYRKGDRFDLHSPLASRDFISVSSAASAVVSMAREMHRVTLSGLVDIHMKRGVYDVGTGVSTTLTEIDNFIMQATRNVNSIVREVPMPDSMVGRYQSYTCAGTGPNPIPILRGSGQTTREGIEEQYGRR